MSATAAVFGKVIGAVAIAGITALGGYNYATTGCVTGMGCGSGVQASGTVLPVADGADATPTDACPLGCDMDGAKATGSELTLTSTEPALGSCCSLDAAESPMDALTLTSTSPEGEKAGSCCSGEIAPAEPAASLTLVADAARGEGTELPACCAGKEADCCKHAGETCDGTCEKTDG